MYNIVTQFSTRLIQNEVTEIVCAVASVFKLSFQNTPIMFLLAFFSFFSECFITVVDVAGLTFYYQ